MKTEDIHLGDWHRILFGDAAPAFMIEVFVRTLIIYIFLLLVMKLMGKRMTGQITLTELAVVITLGAIVSPVMQMPDKGILFGILSLLVALAFQRGINLWAFKNEKIEHLTQGKMILLIKDGIIDTKQLKKIRMTQQQLFGQLREKNIENLAEVERLYVEACGEMSVFKYDTPKVGLPVMPSEDKEILNKQFPVDPSVKACVYCGHIQQPDGDGHNKCDVCGHSQWGRAFINTIVNNES